MSKQSRRPNRAARHNAPPVGKKKRSRSNVIFAIVIAAAVAVLIGVATMLGGGGKSRENGRVTVGAKAPSFAGENVITRRRLTSADLAGRNVLYFFNEGVMCQACLVQIQALEKHAAHLAQRNLTLVSITNDDPSTLRAAAYDYKIMTPLIADPTRELTTRFGALGGGMHADTADHTFILVDSEGIVRFDRDYPSMWIDPAKLLEVLPKV